MLDTLFFVLELFLFTEQVISAYQEEQDNAEGKNAVTDKEHQYHSNGNPE
ncbi:MAG: hypothetical protein J6K04_03990 [Lachnospiraceae bacterium]|nr:hypothetical protein [Lachnospiraceae bacterium]